MLSRLDSLFFLKVSVCAYTDAYSVLPFLFFLATKESRGVQLNTGYQTLIRV